jgi:hypothetical protein
MVQTLPQSRENGASFGKLDLIYGADFPSAPSMRKDYAS